MGKSGIGNARRARLDNLREAALHRDVVARRMPAGFNGRWTRRQWAHASLFATLAALVAAIVPGFSANSPCRRPRTRRQPAPRSPSPLPPLPLAKLRGQTGDSWQIVRVERGQTLGSLFEDLDLPAATMHALLEQPGAKQSLTRMKPGTELALRPAGRRPACAPSATTATTPTASNSPFDGDKIREKVIERPTAVAHRRHQRQRRQVAVPLGPQARPVRRRDQHADRRHLQVRHRLQRRRRRQRPLQRRGRADLARRRADPHRPGAGGHLHRRRQAAFRLPLRAQRQGRVLHRRRPPAEEELHPHADPVRAPDLELRLAPPSGARHACASTRASTTARPPARRSWPPAMRACSSSAGRAATAAR